MARPKKVKKVEEETVTAPVVPTPIDKVSVDFPSEGLNNLAKKINEIIDHLNAQG